MCPVMSAKVGPLNILCGPSWAKILATPLRRKTMKTRGRNGRVVFIVLSALQIQENNEYRLVNSRVNSIVLKCLETLVEHEPRVYEMTSQSTIVYFFSIR